MFNKLKRWWRKRSKLNYAVDFAKHPPRLSLREVLMALILVALATAVAIAAELQPSGAEAQTVAPAVTRAPYRTTPPFKIPTPAPPDWSRFTQW